MDVNGSRIAFFGGSFDPPHLGHLAIARAARDALQLDRVLFAPVGAQPLKPIGSTAAFADRVAMTELAIAGEHGMAISLADAPDPSGEANYTLETLRKLRQELDTNTVLFCLMGADSFVSLRKWRGAQEIPFAASLIVASRPGQLLGDLAAFLPSGLRLEQPSPVEYPSGIEIRGYSIRDEGGRTAPFYLLPGLDVEVSASAIRRQVRAKESAGADRLVPGPVRRYIREHGLYR